MLSQKQITIGLKSSVSVSWKKHRFHFHPIHPGLLFVLQVWTVRAIWAYWATLRLHALLNCIILEKYCFSDSLSVHKPPISSTHLITFCTYMICPHKKKENILGKKGLHTVYFSSGHFKLKIVIWQIFNKLKPLLTVKRSSKSYLINLWEQLARYPALRMG